MPSNHPNTLLFNQAQQAAQEIRKNIRDATRALWSFDTETRERAVETAKHILGAVKSFVEGLEESLPSQHHVEFSELSFYAIPETKYPEDPKFYREAFVQICGFLRVAMQAIERIERQRCLEPNHEFRVRISPITSIVQHRRARSS